MEGQDFAIRKGTSGDYVPEDEIGKLADLDLATLRIRWTTLWQSQPPARISRELLMQAIAYRMQENTYGGLTTSERKVLMGRPAAAHRGPSRVDRSIKPGTRFLREWQGRTIEVIATADGRFLYRDQSHASLSAIARKVTGTRWSGPAFFGIATGKDGGHGPT